MNVFVHVGDLACPQWIRLALEHHSEQVYLYDRVQCYVVKSNYPYQRKGVTLAISWL